MNALIPNEAVAVI